ncbi:MAG: DUF5063 domain-containing protein [Sphingobacteriales bacterium]|jgi:hypothetical protein
MKARQMTATEGFSVFLQTARDYCDFIEDINRYSEVAFFESALKHLLTLYTNAQSLELVEVTFDSDFSPLLTKDNIREVRMQLSNIIDSRYYWHVFDPSEQVDINPVCGDIVDDLEDIYWDLKNAIMLYDKGSEEEVESALWDFKFLFDNHWGDHCMNAQYAIHHIYKHLV